MSAVTTATTRPVFAIPHPLRGATGLCTLSRVHSMGRPVAGCQLRPPSRYGTPSNGLLRISCPRSKPDAERAARAGRVNDRSAAKAIVHGTAGYTGRMFGLDRHAARVTATVLVFAAAIALVYALR